MIDNELFDMIDQQMPKFNPLLAGGFARNQLKYNEEYIDRLFKQVARDFPPNVKYLGPKAISPLAEFRLVSRFKRSGRTAYDLSKTSVYLKLYRFSVDGEELMPTPLYHIYAEQGSIAFIKNAKFTISPVLADVSLSVKGDSLFIKMSRTMLTFRKIMGYFMADDQLTNSYLIWSQIYNTKTRKTIGTLPHYLFCRFGVMEAFRRVGVIPVICDRYNIDRDQYPEDKWVTCTTAPSRGRSRKTNRVQCEVAILIPREIWERSAVTQSMVAGFFYVAEYAPTRITVEDFDSIPMWRLMLGRMILPQGDSDGKVLNQINTHIDSVSGFLDGMVRENLRDDGYGDIHDTYDLFDLVNKRFMTMVAQNTESIASMYGKRLVVNAYVNKDINAGITNMLFAVQKQQASKGFVRKAEMEKILKANIKYNLILGLNRDHSEVSSVSSASDCMLHKVTSLAVLQTETANKTKGPVFDESKIAHISIAENCAIMSLPSKDPSGRSRLGFCSVIDEKGTLLRNPALEHITIPAQEFIKRN